MQLKILFAKMCVILFKPQCVNPYKRPDDLTNSAATRNRAFGAHHHVKQEWCETSEKNLRNGWRPELWSISGPKMTQKLGLWGLYSTHLLKQLKLTCKSRLMQNQWKLFEKMTKDWNLDLFWDPKWPKNWASEAHILHTSKSSYN